MKKYIMLCTLGFFLISCGGSKKSLYSWGDYQQRSYDYVKNPTDENLAELIQSYEKIIDKQNGIRQTIPPGICADYGYLLVKNGETEKGLEFLKREIALYPESAVFVSQIIKKVEE